ncbi:MAG: hypothetical protein HYY40_13955 [Bacteroidetes bacterium]|nr:hypothetical protein [Bacteroidota bacterium]
MKDNSNTMQYSPLKIQQFKMWLEEMKEQNKTQYFEVFVDDFKIVPRTDNIEDFDRHEQYLDEDTQKVTVLYYNTPNSNRYKKNIYLLKNKSQPVQQNQTLSGPEVDAKIEEKVTIAKERWDCEQVKKELETTKGKLGEAEDFIEKLKGIIADTEKKLQDAKSMGDFAAVIKELAPQFLSLKKNPKENLAGQQTEKKPEEEASFSKASSEKTSELSETEKRYIEAGKMLEEKFNPQELDIVLSIIDTLGTDKSNIKPVAELLNINSKTQTKK